MMLVSLDFMYGVDGGAPIEGIEVRGHPKHLESFSKIVIRCYKRSSIVDTECCAHGSAIVVIIGSVKMAVNGKQSNRSTRSVF